MFWSLRLGDKPEPQQGLAGPLYPELLGCPQGTADSAYLEDS